MVLDVRRTSLGERLVPYEEAWQEQRRLHAAVVDGTGPDTVLLLEHEPVYTAGKRTRPEDRPLDGTPVVDVDRGGSITFHGPGQLVGYPIVRLPEHVYVVDHLRRVEEVMIRTARDLGVPAGRVRGRSGAWVAADDRGPERKLGAIGIRVSQHVSMHGFALNCDVDEQWFGRIVPCGIADAGTTSLAAELGRPVTLGEVADAVEPHLRDLLAWGPFERSPDLLERPPATAPTDDQPLASLIRIASR